MCCWQDTAGQAPGRSPQLALTCKRPHFLLRLDYSRLSDIDDTVGYWHVVASGSGSRVTYSAALLLKGWWPKPVIDMLLATSLGPLLRVASA